MKDSRKAMHFKNRIFFLLIFSLMITSLQPLKIQKEWNGLSQTSQNSSIGQWLTGNHHCEIDLGQFYRLHGIMEKVCEPERHERDIFRHFFWVIFFLFSLSYWRKVIQKDYPYGECNSCTCPGIRIVRYIQQKDGKKKKAYFS